MRSVLDTNPLIYFLNGILNAPALACIETAMRSNAAYSVITRMEVLGWQGLSTRNRQLAEVLLNSLEEIPLDRIVVERVIELRSALAIKLPDAIIAASALRHGLPLMTHNVKDFNRIEGLQIIDPFLRE